MLEFLGDNPSHSKVALALQSTASIKLNRLFVELHGCHHVEVANAEDLKAHDNTDAEIDRNDDNEQIVDEMAAICSKEVKERPQVHSPVYDERKCESDILIEDIEVVSRI